MLSYFNALASIRFVYATCGRRLLLSLRCKKEKKVVYGQWKYTSGCGAGLYTYVRLEIPSGHSVVLGYLLQGVNLLHWNGNKQWVEWGCKGTQSDACRTRSRKIGNLDEERVS